MVSTVCLASLPYNAKFNVLTRQEGADDDPHKIIYTTTYAATGAGKDIDVLTESKTVQGVTTLLSTTAYNAATRVITSQTSYVIQGAQTIAHTTTYAAPNTHGQPIQTTSPRGGITKWTYLANGRLDKVETKAPGQTVFKVQAAYTYDAIGRVIGEVDADSLLLSHEYDNLNRRLKTIYQDATFTQRVYSCCTLTSLRARDGSMTQYSYDALNRPTQVISPGGQTTANEYDANGNITRLRFGLGEWVAWEYDAGNRMTAKVYPDGKRNTYGYDESKGGRLMWTQDASNRETTYNYNADGLIESVTHPSLPTQSYTYDAEGRTLTWTDATSPNSRLTSYIYDANGRLTSLDGPLANDTFTYTYDQWSRITSWSYAGSSESYTFDNLDRVTDITNPLGTFHQTYEGDTGILTEVQYPLAGMKTTYQRLPAAQDRLLTAIIHSAPSITGGGELARYDYTYTQSKQIATWRQAQPGMTPR